MQDPGEWKKELGMMNTSATKEKISQALFNAQIGPIESREVSRAMDNLMNPKKDIVVFKGQRKEDPVKKKARKSKSKSRRGNR